MTDPDIVPAHIRRQVLKAALGAVEGILDCEGISLDLFARCDLLELALDEYHQHLEAQLPPEPLENWPPGLGTAAIESRAQRRWWLFSMGSRTRKSCVSLSAT